MAGSAVQEVLDVVNRDLSAASTTVQNQLGNTALGRVVNSALDVIDPTTAPRTVSSTSANQTNVMFLIIGGVLVYWLFAKRR